LEFGIWKLEFGILKWSLRLEIPLCTSGERPNKKEIPNSNFQIPNSKSP
jgi:hypothetical protein